MKSQTVTVNGACTSAYDEGPRSTAFDDVVSSSVSVTPGRQVGLNAEY